MAILLVIAVVAVAYGTRPPSLGVAEFAPAARQSLEAPPSTDAGSSGGSSAGRRNTSTTAPAMSATTESGGDQPGPPTTQAPRTRQCAGNPPRQIEDPMSPVCLAAIFEGDNGGATARGVSATEITIGIPWFSPDVQEPYTKAMFDFFSRRYEFYGRRLKLVAVQSVGNDDAAKQRAAAAELAAKSPFAVIVPRQSHPAYVQELARQGIVSVVSDPNQTLVSDRAVFDALHPYVWSGLPSLEAMSRNLGGFLCAELAGRAARHAGEASLRQTTRKFGIVASGEASAPTPSTQVLESVLAGCGAPYEVLRLDASRDSSTAFTTAVNSLEADGVTTLMCLCPNFSSASMLASAARGSSFYPEWVFVPATADEQYFPMYNLDAKQRGSLIGFIPQGKQLPQQTLRWFQALLEEAPSLAASAFSRHQAYVIDYDHLYLALLVLSAGIQGAGPALTAESFAAALMSTQFANTGSGQAPYWQPSVGFGPGDHGFIDDYAVAWWHPGLVPPTSTWSAGVGTWCYVGRGNRFRTGAFPGTIDATLFDPAVSSASC